MTESGDTCEDDFSIEVNVAIVSIQLTKKDEGSLEPFSEQQQAS